MTKIFFVGDMRSPFIQGDVDLLKEDHDVYIFNVVFTKPIQAPLYIFKFLGQILNIRNSNLIWIWFADIPALPIIIIAKLFDVPTVVNIGGFEVSGIKDINYGNQIKPIRGWITRWILRNADALIVPSPEYDIKTMKVGLGVKLMDGSFALPEDEDYYYTHKMANIYMIPNFIDTKMCDEMLPEKENLVVTAVCSKFAYDYKGIPTFKETSNLIPFETKILENLPRAEYEDILKRAKIYCQLSRDETFGISLVEAMAYSCVPVVSDKGALPWIVQDTGVIVPYGNPTATYEAIIKAMTMDGSKARERARYFSREKKQEAVRKLIKEIL